ncbi:MAG: FAD-dependent oxidoreductase [Alphaproteobacteria bacterium]|nr:FAD-dependent oxidoreductase [Alphaproteobacteria bacterium]
MIGVDVHVIGAGLAGLSAALDLADAGARVALHEAAPQAGGRCRSFADQVLEREIDNGGHVLLGGNKAVFDYLDRIGSRAEMEAIAPAAFPFMDLATGETWSIRPNAGPIPWWIMAPSRRVPGTRPADYAEALNLYFASETDTVARRLDPDGPLFQALWEPLCVAALNTNPREAAAKPLARVLAESFGKGEVACRPYLPRNGLTPALIDPAVLALARMGVTRRFGVPLEALSVQGGRVTGLRFADGDVSVGDACVVLALPPYAIARLLPDLKLPQEMSPIVNVHFRLDEAVALPGGARLLGLVGGTAQWLIARGDVVSVTVSAADDLVERPNDAVAALIWREIAKALGKPPFPVPPYRTVKERRATLRLTPRAEALRPGPLTATQNLFLAGDWTQTDLPPTMESAIRSGRAVSRAILQGHARPATIPREAPHDGARPT